MLKLKFQLVIVLQQKGINIKYTEREYESVKDICLRDSVGFETRGWWK